MRLRVAVAAAALAAACGARGPAHPAPGRGPSAQVRADIDRAERAELARRHDLARTAYEQAVADAHDPASVAIARREFAETLETWGATGEAIAQLQAAVRAAPGDVGSWHDLGILYHVQGDDSRAVTALEHARSLAPRSLRVRIALAAAYQCTNARAAAIAEYRALLALDPPERLAAKIRYWVGVLERSTELPHCRRPDRPDPPARPAPPPAP